MVPESYHGYWRAISSEEPDGTIDTCNALIWRFARDRIKACGLTFAVGSVLRRVDPEGDALIVAFSNSPIVFQVSLTEKPGRVLQVTLSAGARRGARFVLHRHDFRGFGPPGEEVPSLDESTLLGKTIGAAIRATGLLREKHFVVEEPPGCARAVHGALANGDELRLYVPLNAARSILLDRSRYWDLSELESVRIIGTARDRGGHWTVHGQTMLTQPSGSRPKSAEALDDRW